MTWRPWTSNSNLPYKEDFNTARLRQLQYFEFGPQADVVTPKSIDAMDVEWPGTNIIITKF